MAFFHCGLAALVAADPARLVRHAHRAHVEHLHAEELLDGALHVVLVGARIDRERHEVARLAADVALLGDERLADHVVHVHDASPAVRRAGEARLDRGDGGASSARSLAWRSTS